MKNKKGENKNYLCQDLKLFSAFVKVDEALGHHVRDSGVNHDQVGQECAQVGNGAVADPARVLLVLLQHLLQVVVVLAGSVRKPRSALADQQLALRHRVVVLLEYSRQLLEYLQLVANDQAPGLLEPVHRVGLEAGHDGLEAGKVFENAQLLGNVDPGGNHSGADRVPRLGVDENRGYDPIADRVELFDGGNDCGGVAISSLVPARPYTAQTLVGNHFLE